MEALAPSVAVRALLPFRIPIPLPCSSFVLSVCAQLSDVPLNEVLQHLLPARSWGWLETPRSNDLRELLQGRPRGDVLAERRSPCSVALVHEPLELAVRDDPFRDQHRPRQR